MCSPFTGVDAGLPAGDCADSDWCQIGSLPAFTGAVALSATDVWAVAGPGVWHWNGTSWQVVYGGQQGYETNGGVYVLANEQLTAIWAFSDTDVWVAGDDTYGNVIHYDGASWTWVPTDPSADGAQYTALWGSAPDDLWLASDSIIEHWDGCTWAVSPGGESALALWGSGPGDVWAVGGGGSLQHWDGGVWGSYANPASAANTTVNGVWGSASGDVWAVGDDGLNGTYGTILHFDGGTWAAATVPSAMPITGVTSGYDVGLNAVWGSSSTDVWAFGVSLSSGPETTGILHYDGTGWSVYANTISSSYSERQLLVGTGAGPGDVWALGENGNILFFNGTDWAYQWDTTQADFTGVWESGPDDVWAAAFGELTGGGGEIFHWDGNNWTTAFNFSNANTDEVRQITGDTNSTDIWAAAYGGAYHFDGGAWSHVTSGVQIIPGTVVYPQFTGIWEDTPSSVWIVGSAGTLYNGGPQGWTLVGDPADGLGNHYQVPLSFVTGLHGGPVFATGQGHTANLADGGTGWLLTLLELPDSTSGAAGTWDDISYFDPDQTSDSDQFFAIWQVSDTEFWAAGSRIAHNVNGVWTDIPMPTGLGIPVMYGVWGSSDSNIWFAGDDSSGQTVIFNWDGTQLTWVDSPFASGIAEAMTGSSAQDIWVVGDNGMMLHYP